MMNRLTGMCKNTSSFVFVLLECRVGDLNHGEPLKGLNQECR